MQNEIITNLEKARRLAFENFEDIVLEPEAVQILVHLFIHPGCKADINLATFATGKPVSLSEISSHIITAFPSQVAKYANRKGITRVTGADLLECFALDHADAVEDNVKALLMEPSYALAHVLTIATATSVKSADQRRLADLDVSISGSTVSFSHVLVPGTIEVAPGQTVFHHFGVVVAAADSKEKKAFARRMQKEQDSHAFLQKTMKQIQGKDVKDIDYSKSAFFKVDMTGKIIEQSKLDTNFQKLWAEEDLKSIKMPQEKKEDSVMFQS